MAAAKKTLDETSGVKLDPRPPTTCPTASPASRRPTGVGTHAPAFEGTITVALSGTPFEVPVVAVDDKVYAQIPLTAGWSDVDPAEYGAPDPAALMSPTPGFSSLLPATTEASRRARASAAATDNDEMLTEYTGTVPGDVVENVIPSATGRLRRRLHDHRRRRAAHGAR